MTVPASAGDMPPERNREPRSLPGQVAWSRLCALLHDIDYNMKSIAPGWVLVVGYAQDAICRRPTFSDSLTGRWRQ